MEINLIKDKRGYYLSLDALIALIVILGVVLVIQPPVSQIPPQVNLQEDLLISLSSIKIGDLNIPYAQSLIASGKIKNLNQTVLEQIGEFFAQSDPEATLLAESILDEINTNKNIGLYFNGLEIATSNKSSLEDSTDIWTSRQIISGIQQGSSAKGFSSRAFLTASSKIDYFYFGGYIGDGNISIELKDSIENVEIEAVFGGDFDVFINNNLVQSHSPTPNTPYSFNLLNDIDQFNSETNTIKFIGKNNNLFIAGGFMKVSRDENQIITASNQKNFPGIEGLINIYDGFYIPGKVDNLEIFLHYNSLQNIFLRIGNTTVFSGNSSGSDTTITLNNATLASILDYDELNKKTIPLRLGIQNVSFSFNDSLDVDVYSVTDLSGSMSASCQSAGIICCLFSGDFCENNNSCEGCDGILDDKIGLAKEANKVFINAILGFSGNRVGLVGYQTQADENDLHLLSMDNASLNAKVNEWTPSGATCICCGINKVVEKVNEDIRENATRSMIVMSDGKANAKCSAQGTGDASGDAIQAACDAFIENNITVHAVGFGEDADEATLQAIASCGGGTYYYSEISNLIGVYEQIAQDVINAIFIEQTIISTNIFSTLYPDSYISMAFEKIIPFGLVINAETPEFGNLISTGNFFIPNDTEPLEANVVSYSGSKWTDNLEILNETTGLWEKIFDLTEYNSEYVNLGDPFIVNIPAEKIRKGNNSLRVSTGLSSINTTGGDIHDKVIYSLVKEISSFSPIVSSAEGCIWTIESEDSTNLTISVPMDYNGTEQCSYTSNNIAYNNNDAIDLAIYRLLLEVDLDSDGKLETKFSEGDLSLTSSVVEGIPFTWDTEVQVRVWR